jgi:hypothetical protein
MSATFGKNHRPIFVGVETKQANRRRKNIPPAAELAERIRDTGATVQGLADEFGVSKSKVARDLNDAGYRSNGQPTFQARQVSTDNARLPHLSHSFMASNDLAAGACVGHDDPELWFPTTVLERNTRGEYAKTVCRSCPVRLACLARALEEEEPALRFGIRGGLDEDERAELAENGAA